MDDDVQLEVAAGSDDPQALFDLLVARAFGRQAVEKPFDVITIEHSVLVR